MSNNITFPAEWFPQSGVQLTWPHSDTDWEYMLEEVTNCYLSIAKEIIKREKLLIVCPNPNDVLQHFTKEEQAQIIISTQNSNDTWTRDHAGIAVFVNNNPTILDFCFNAWGMKFKANYDNQITRNLYEDTIFQSHVEYASHLNFVLEGGSIESDGKGTLLTTSSCLTSPNRNQPMTLHEIESYLKKSLGINRILFLNHGYLAGDDTDNHIDTLARFCDKNTIAYVQCDDTHDEHYSELSKMEEQLRTFKTFEGKPYNLIPLPMADPVFDNGERLPATYANFLIINEAVLMPFYQSSKDEIARKQLQKAFPKREIIGIDCRPLIKQHGSLHCITMQYPKGFL